MRIRGWNLALYLRIDSIGFGLVSIEPNNGELLFQANPISEFSINKNRKVNR